MATLDFVQTNFTRGELSPRIRGRIDFQGFFNGVEELNNFIVLPLGGVIKRPGTRFVAEAANNDRFSRLVPFEFSVDESYALEFNDQVVRFFANGGILAANDVSTSVSNPDFSNGLTNWSDVSTGGASVSAGTATGTNYTNGDAALLSGTIDRSATQEVISARLTAGVDAQGNTEEARIEQKIQVPSGEESNNHVLLVGLDGNANNAQGEIHVGSTSLNDDLLNASKGVGWHLLTVNPGGNSEIYINIRNRQDSYPLTVHRVEFTDIAMFKVIDNYNFQAGLADWEDKSVSGANVNAVTLASSTTSVNEGEAIVEQAVSVATADKDTVHTLMVAVDDNQGTKSMAGRVRVGTTSGANDLLDRSIGIGWHLIDVDPSGNTTIYVQVVQDNDHNKVGELAVHKVDFVRGGPLELPAPYTATETQFLGWSQSADVLFLTHPSYAVRELRRFGQAEFSLVPYDFRDGPYRGVNVSDTALTPSAISGRVTVTANVLDGINGGNGFSDKDRGRLLRLKTTKAAKKKIQGDGSTTKFDFDFFVPDTEALRVTLTNTGSGTTQNIAEGSTVDAFEGTDYSVELNNPQAGGTVDFSVSKAPASDIEVTLLRDIAFWGWGEIVKVNSKYEVELLVRGDSGLGSAEETKFWRLGEWCDCLGWPHVATFHNERLTFGGSDSNAQTLWFSQTSNFNSFSPSAVDGTVKDDSGINITLATSEVNFVRWLSSINSGLAVGTSGAEFLVRSATATEPLSPTSIEAVRQTTRGSAAFVPPERVGLSTIFVQRGNEVVRELAFDFNVDGLVARDFSIVSEHLLKPNIFRLSYQQNPNSILWMVRGDSRLLGFTLESDQEVFAWHQHTLGGSFSGADAAVETQTVTTEGGTDRLWMVVKRTINGTTKRHVEYMEFPWRNSEKPIEDAFFVDSGLTGDFQGSPQSTVSGLDHLEGETVKVIADGATHPDRVVQSGSISLDREAEKVHVGLGYTASLKTFPMDEGVRGQVSRGKVKRISQIHLLFHETVGALFGRDQLDRMPFRDSSMKMDQAVPPFTGNKSFRMPMRHDELAFVRVKSDQSLPCTILNVTAEMEFYDT